MAVAPIGDWQTAVREASWKQAEANRIGAQRAPSHDPEPSVSAPSEAPPPQNYAPGMQLGGIATPLLGVGEAKSQVPLEVPQLLPAHDQSLPPVGFTPFAPSVDFNQTMDGNANANLIPNSASNVPNDILGGSTGGGGDLGGINRSSGLGELNADAQPFAWNPANSSSLNEYLANLVLDDRSR